MNVTFVNGRTHAIEKLGLKTKLKCGLMALHPFSFKRQWYFTFFRVNCENCLRKMGKKNATDLSNYHSFIKE